MSPIAGAAEGGGVYAILDAWFPVSEKGGPVPRVDHSAVWTGSEMIVWGGQTDLGSDAFLASGGRYVP